MRVFFPTKQIERDAIAHAREVTPEESCGVVVDGRYYPCDNTAQDTLMDFRIHPWTFMMLENRYNRIEAIVHSHYDYPWPSKHDQQQQMRTNIPWGLVNITKGGVASIHWWGDQISIPPLLGREFIYGILDCYSLCRDYFFINRGFRMENVPREWEWWQNGENIFVELAHKWGFTFIDDLEPGTMILAAIRSKVPNHSGIYIGNGIVLNHFYKRISRREPIGPWMKMVTHIAKYVGKKEEREHG